MSIVPPAFLTAISVIFSARAESFANKTMRNLMVSNRENNNNAFVELKRSILEVILLSRGFHKENFRQYTTYTPAPLSIHCFPPSIAKLPIFVRLIFITTAVCTLQTKSYICQRKSNVRKVSCDLCIISKNNCNQNIKNSD